MSNVLGEPIAVLVDGRHVRCQTCSKSRVVSRREANLYQMDIGTYGQWCHECNKVINQGWPELQPQEDCKNCLCCLCGLQSPVDATVHKGCSDYEMARIDAEGSSMEELQAAQEIYDRLPDDVAADLARDEYGR